MKWLMRKLDINWTNRTRNGSWINPTNLTRRGEAKGSVNSIVAKINSIESYVSNEGALPMAVEKDAAQVKKEKVISF